jgi:hypothetical protein
MRLHHRPVFGASLAIYHQPEWRLTSEKLIDAAIDWELPPPSNFSIIQIDDLPSRNEIPEPRLHIRLILPPRLSLLAMQDRHHTDL